MVRLVVYLFPLRHMRDILLLVSAVLELPNVLLIRTLPEAMEGMIITTLQVRDILFILPIPIILRILKKTCPILC